MQDLVKQALYIAKTGDVSTFPDCAVVYSVSFMPCNTNKELALNYISNQPNAKTLDTTPCGKKLIELGLSGKVNEISSEITNIWKIASQRYIECASGNIVAFVDGVDERSTFYSTELEQILKNEKIKTINGVDKKVFASNLKPYRY